MTQDEWRACANPQAMVHFLGGKASDRKLRLFAVACCRNIWPVLPDKTSRQAVTILERIADGLSYREELPDEYRGEVFIQYLGKPPKHSDAVSAAASWRPVEAANAAALEAAERMREPSDFFTTYFAKQREQAGIIRELFGNPFRRLAADPGWLTPT